MIFQTSALSNLSNKIHKHCSYSGIVMKDIPSKIDMGIQVGFDEDFEHSWWRIQRIAWAGMILFILAGIGGLFGRGLFSKTVTVQPGSMIQVTYERFARYQTPSFIEVAIDKKAIQDDSIRLHISGNILDKLHLQNVTPQPWLAEPLTSGSILIFRTNTTQDMAKIRFDIMPSQIGKAHNVIGLDGLPEVEFNQFIWP